MLENIKPIFTTPKEWFLSIEFLSYFTREIRIYIWSSGALLCLALLIYLLFLRKNRAGLFANIQAGLLTKNKETISNLIQTYGINESFTPMISKILAKDKKNKLFFEDSRYFEKVVSEYTKTENFTTTEENELSQIRYKLQFTTINPDISFVRTQQLHNGGVLKATIPDAAYDISFETKIMDNFESYFLVSYPQIDKEDYVLNSGQKIIFEVIVTGVFYNFESEVLPDDSNLAGLKLAHSLTLSKTT